MRSGGRVVGGERFVFELVFFLFYFFAHVLKPFLMGRTFRMIFFKLFECDKKILQTNSEDKTGDSNGARWRAHVCHKLTLPPIPMQR